MVSEQKTSYLFLISLLIHLLVFFIFIVSFEWSSNHFVIENSNNKTPALNALLVTETKMQMPEPLLPSKPTEELKKNPAEKPLPQAKKILEPLKEKTVAIPDPHKKQIEKQKLIEKEFLADLQKIKNQKKKIKAKELEKAFEKELKATKAKSLEQQLKTERNHLSQAQAQKMQGVVDKYKALILQTISQHWIVPPSVNKSLSTQLLIRLAPGGVVLDVQLVKSSGDENLDRSARLAVLKASPLPVPENTEEFGPFRQFILKVKPENIISRDSDVT